MVELKLIRILGIETSCDETAAAVIENGRALLGSPAGVMLFMVRCHSTPEPAARLQEIRSR